MTPTQTEIQKPKRGRPKKHVDLELVEKLAHIQCTYSEIASTLSISVDTLTRNKDFAATYKRGAESGRKSLRRMQFESANKGNITMQIWLGKQYLGQSDYVTKEIHEQFPPLHKFSIDQLDEMLDMYRKNYPELVARAAIETGYTLADSEVRRRLPAPVRPYSDPDS